MKHREKSLSQFCQALKRYDRFLLSCHVTPEGDAVGSLLAMDLLLRKLGKQTTLICEDPIPNRLLAVLSCKRWRRLDEIKKPAAYFQALITTDCPTLERIGRVQDFITPDTIIFNIDHHISNDAFGDYNYVCPEASATGEVIFHIFKQLGVKIRRQEAAYLYIAIVTDTGNFKYSNTTVACHRTVAELIATGFDVEKINDAINATYSLNKINLYSRLLSRVKTAVSGQIAWVGMERSDLSHSGATYEDTEGFIDFLKYLKEVRIAFFMSELEGGHRIKVSFRSRGSYDVNRIATYFHGGGHRKASGCIIRGTLAQAEKMILDCIRKEIRFKGEK